MIRQVEKYPSLYPNWIKWKRALRTLTDLVVGCYMPLHPTLSVGWSVGGLVCPFWGSAHSFLQANLKAETAKTRHLKMHFFLLSYWSMYVYISKSTMVSDFSSNRMSILGLITREVSGLPDPVKIECWQKSFIMGANQVFCTFFLKDPLKHAFPLSQPKNLTLSQKFCVSSEWSNNEPEIANEAPV